MVSSDKKNDLEKFITKDINLWLTRIAGTMLPSVTGITLESLLPSTNRRFTHDTRIHGRHSEYIWYQLWIFYLFFSYEAIQISQFRCFEIKNKPYQSLFFLNKHYLLLFVITAWIYIVKIIKTQCLMVLFLW